MRAIFRFVLVLCTMLPVGAIAQQGPDADRNPLKREHLQLVPIQTEDGRFAEIRTVLVRRGNQVLAVDARQGVEQLSQSRVRLNDIPILGDLFALRYDRDALERSNQVGTVHRQGDTLYVALDPNQPQSFFTEIVVLNREYSYRLTGHLGERYAGLAPPPAWPADAPAIGRAYAGEGNTLLLLIEPSVLTNTIL